jgi:hypothetical protein
MVAPFVPLNFDIVKPAHCEYLKKKKTNLTCDILVKILTRDAGRQELHFVLTDSAKRVDDGGTRAYRHW